MQTTWLTLLALVTKLFAARNEIVRDYFIYKDVPGIVAFLCPDGTNEIDHFHLTKILNQEGISVAILYPEFKFSVKTVMAVSKSRFGVFLDLNCANWYSRLILSESSEFGAYTSLYNWLLFGKRLNDSIQMLNDDTFSISTDLVIATPTVYGGYELHDVYNHGKDNSGKLNVTKFASWHHETGLNVTLVQPKYQRRLNFHGMKVDLITVTTYRPDDMPLEDYLRDYTTRELDTMSKFAYVTVMHFADIFNLTMEIEATNHWDLSTSDGTHVGMLGILYRSEADLGASPAILYHDRLIGAQLIGLIFPFRSCFMFRSNTERVHDEFIRPFTPEAWALSGIMLVICVIVLGLTFKLEFVKTRVTAWYEAVLVAVGIVCQQGSLVTPQYLASRMAIMDLLMFSLLLYNYYSASVVSAQLNKPFDKMNDSLHELSKSHLEMAAEPVVYTNYGLTNIDNWEVKEFYEKRWKPLDEKALYLPVEEGLARVAEGGFAYHTDPNTGYPYIERHFSDEVICELTEVHLFRPQKMGLFGRRNSPFTKMSQIGLTKLLNAGILHRQLKRWTSRKPVCFRESFRVQSVSMLTTAPAFVILCIGICLAAAICILENVIVEWQYFTKSNLSM